jgi:hypothetical protein
VFLRILNEDERIEEIRRYLDATLEEFQKLVEKAGGFEDNRVGNGWQPASLTETLSTAAPMPPSEILGKVKSVRWRALGMALSNLPKARTLNIEFEKPHLEYHPYWIAKGYHECIFFRGASYRVPTSDDVLAVEVDGKLRNLVLRDAKPHSFLEQVKDSIEWVTGLASNKPREFILDGVTELARRYKKASLHLDAYGRNDKHIERFLRRNPPLQISDLDQIKREHPSAEIVQLQENKDSVIKKLRDTVVQAPKIFTRILSNRFEVTDLTLLYLPVYRVKYQYAKKEGVVNVNGSTGELIS